MANQNADVVTEFIEGLVETYPGLQYLDGFPQVYFLWKYAMNHIIFVNKLSHSILQIKVVLRADVLGAAYDKVAVISGTACY